MDWAAMSTPVSVLVALIGAIVGLLAWWSKRRESAFTQMQSMLETYRNRTEEVEAENVKLRSRVKECELKIKDLEQIVRAVQQSRPGETW